MTVSNRYFLLIEGVLFLDENITFVKISLHSHNKKYTEKQHLHGNVLRKMSR